MFLLTYLVNSVTEEIPCALSGLDVTVGIKDTAVNQTRILNPCGLCCPQLMLDLRLYMGF